MNTWKLETITCPPKCGIHNTFMYYDPAGHAWLCQQCKQGREQSAPGEPLVSVNEPRFTCAKCGSSVAESYRYDHQCEAENTAHRLAQPEGGEKPRGVVKNRDCEGGQEFWDHVENIAKNGQPPNFVEPVSPPAAEGMTSHQGDS